jgi:hypothetical protein
MTNKTFKLWLYELWQDNCTELEEYHLQRYTLKEYYNKYKWWLRREYRHQQQEGKV